MKIKKNVISGFLAIAVVALSAGYVLYNQNSHNNDELPPDFFLGSTAFKGFMVEENFYKFDSDDVASFSAPTGTKVTLKDGLNYYYSNKDITVKEVIDSIVPVDGNRILIAYYEPKFEGSETGNERFWGYPIGPNTISSPSSFAIPEQLGFAIFSQGESDIYNISPASIKPTSRGLLTGVAQPPYKHIANIKNGWMLMPNGDDLSELLSNNEVKERIAEMYYQSGTERFSPCGITHSMDDCLSGAGEYHMLWINFLEKVEDEVEDEGDYEVEDDGDLTHDQRLDIEDLLKKKETELSKELDDNYKAEMERHVKDMDVELIEVDDDPFPPQPENFQATLESINPGGEIIRLQWDRMRTDPTGTYGPIDSYEISFYLNPDKSDMQTITVANSDAYYYDFNLNAAAANGATLEEGQSHTFEITAIYENGESQTSQTFYQ